VQSLWPIRYIEPINENKFLESPEAYSNMLVLGSFMESVKGYTMILAIKLITICNVGDFNAKKL